MEETKQPFQLDVIHEEGERLGKHKKDPQNGSSSKFNPKAKSSESSLDASESSDSSEISPDTKKKSVSNPVALKPLIKASPNKSQRTQKEDDDQTVLTFLPKSK